MITPSFGLTATERVLPKLAIDFTTATLDPRVTFTRSGNTATYINSSGVITAINANLPRFDYNPTTLVCQGLLIEEARTNLVLNSLIDGTILNTQIVTTSATAYTLSFYGTGNIVLSGTHSATVTGTGAYPSRTTYAFTPTAGALTLTVSGTVQYAQLEAGSFATSFIPTSVASVTRNADVATMTGTNFSSWFTTSSWSFMVQADRKQSVSGTNFSALSVSDGTANNESLIRLLGTTGTQSFGSNGGAANQWILAGTDIPVNTFGKMCLGFTANNVAYSSVASNPTTDLAATLPALNQLIIGSNVAGTQYVNSHIAKVFYYPQRLINAEVQAFSKG